MARVLLTAGQTFGIIGNFTPATQVFGTNSAETVLLTADSNVVFDASFNQGGDTIRIDGPAGGYSVRLEGSNVILTADNGANIVIPVGEAGVDIAFTDGTRELRFDEASGNVLLGEQEVTGTAQPVTPGDGGTGEPGEEGEIFTLTAGIDNIKGTDGDDTIRAFKIGADATLQVFDVIDGGAGKDTLSIAEGAVIAGAAPVIKNVEIINNAGGGFDLSAVSGAERINSSENAKYTGASLQTVFGASGNAIAVEIGVAGGLAGKNDTLALAVANNANAVTFTTDDNAGVEHVTLAAEGDTGKGALADGVDLTKFTNVQTVTITGSGDVSVGVDSKALTGVDASGLTGVLTLDVIGADKAAAIKAGAGNDTVTVTSDGNNTISGGAGDDTITVNGKGDNLISGGAGVDVIKVIGNGDNVISGDDGDDKITVIGDGDNVISGGAGKDTIVIEGIGDNRITGGAASDSIDLTKADGADTLIYTALGDSTFTNFDIVAGFNAGDDFIDLSALNLAGADAIAQADTTATTLGGLSDGVIDLFGDNAVAFFKVQEGGNDYTYVLADVNGDGNFSATSDLVIRLNGDLNLTADNFVFA